MRIVMSEKKRATIMIDVRIDKKLRARQSKEIIDSQGSISLSKIVNNDLAKYYKLTNFQY
jgi:hypothetical protein